jgi:hypothetical protein
MHSAHDPRALLHHGNSRAHRRLLVTVTYLQVRNRREALTGLHHKAQKVKQRLVGPLKAAA